MRFKANYNKGLLAPNSTNSTINSLEQDATNLYLCGNFSGATGYIQDHLHYFQPLPIFLISTSRKSMEQLIKEFLMAVAVGMLGERFQLRDFQT